MIIIKPPNQPERNQALHFVKCVPSLFNSITNSTTEQFQLLLPKENNRRKKNVANWRMRLFSFLCSYSCSFVVGYITCSGHRIGTAEVESALVSHPQCAEAAVVGVEHEVYIIFSTLVYTSCQILSTLSSLLQGSCSAIFI